MKRVFLNRVLREKVLLTVFVTLAATIWGMSTAQRARVAGIDWRTVRADQAAQMRWLERADDIAAQAVKATRNLDPAKTLNVTRLVGEVSNLATQAGLAADIGAQRTKLGTDRFAFNVVQVNFRGAELPALLRFYAALNRRAPYLALEQCSVAVDRAHPGQLNVSLQVVSVELSP
jgi:hypothetical protein